MNLIRFMFATGVTAVLVILSVLIGLDIPTVFSVVALLVALDNRVVIGLHQGALKAIINNVGAEELPKGVVKDDSRAK